MDFDVCSLVLEFCQTEKDPKEKNTHTYTHIYMGLRN